MIAAKTLRMNKVTGWFCWIAGGAFIVSGLAFQSTMPGLAYFCYGLGAVFLVAGYFYIRVARKTT